MALAFALQKYYEKTAKAVRIDEENNLEEYLLLRD